MPISNVSFDRDNLSPEERLRGAGIELSTATRQLYANRSRPIWENKPDLFEKLRAYAASHGIHDTFVDSATINSLLATRSREDRMLADRLMTESIIRTAKEISNRSDVRDLAKRFSDAMANPDSKKAQKDIEAAIDAAGPQHPIYLSMREQYQRLYANGNLNNPKLASLRVNMARIRQQGFDDSVAENSLQINIPEGFLRGKINGQDLTSRVIIGAAPTGDGQVKTTPIAKGNIEAMEMQPTWYIPNSIAERKKLFDKIPKLQELYAQLPPEQQTGTYRFSVMLAGDKTPTVYDIDWSKLGNKDVSPFSQPPGPTNPLGAIKVILGGEFGRQSIRLHDTAAASRGNSFDNYAQSSGCIRVQNIAQIAGALAADQTLGQKYGSPNNTDFFTAIMRPGATDETGRPIWDQPQFAGKRIPIQKGISVRTVYNTVTWDPQRQMAVVHKDIYNRDVAADKPSRNAMPRIKLASYDEPAVQQEPDAKKTWHINLNPKG